MHKDTYFCPLIFSKFKNVKVFEISTEISNNKTIYKNITDYINFFLSLSKNDFWVKLIDFDQINDIEDLIASIFIQAPAIKNYIQMAKSLIEKGEIDHSKLNLISNSYKIIKKLLDAFFCLFTRLCSSGLIKDTNILNLELNDTMTDNYFDELNEGYIIDNTNFLINSGIISIPNLFDYILLFYDDHPKVSATIVNNCFLKKELINEFYDIFPILFSKITSENQFDFKNSYLKNLYQFIFSISNQITVESLDFYIKLAKFLISNLDNSYSVKILKKLNHKLLYNLSDDKFNSELINEFISLFKDPKIPLSLVNDFFSFNGLEKIKKYYNFL